MGHTHVSQIGTFADFELAAMFVYLLQALWCTSFSFWTLVTLVCSNSCVFGPICSLPSPSVEFLDFRVRAS